MKRNNLRQFGIMAGFVASILLAPGSLLASVDRDRGGFHDRETKEWATPEQSMRQVAKEKKEAKEAKAKADAEADAARKQLEEARLKAEK